PERQDVRVDDPGDRRRVEAEVGLDGGERDVDDRGVEHDDELRGDQQREGDHPPAATRGGGGGRPELIGGGAGCEGGRHDGLLGRRDAVHVHCSGAPVRTAATTSWMASTDSAEPSASCRNAMWSRSATTWRVFVDSAASWS